MLKKILLFIIIFIFSFANTFACSIPPDILSRFYIYEENDNLKVKYSLYTWQDFIPKINELFKKNTWQELNEKNIDIFIKEFLEKNATLTLNNEKLELIFESVKFYKDLSNQDPYFEIGFKTNKKSLWKNNEFKIDFSKKTFWQITNLVHSYIYSDIEENLDFDWYTKIWEDNFDNYKFNWKKYWVLGFTQEESDKKNIYILKILDFWKIENNEKKSDKKQANPLLKVNDKNSNSFNFFDSSRKYFEDLLKKDLNIFEIIFWFIFAIIFWALHWLLPWHSKSIIWAYAANNNKNSKNKELFLLILTITLTHTIFIFILAFFINLLHLWIWSSTLYLHYFSSFLYIIFWIYFVYISLKTFLKKKNEPEKCSCCAHNHNHNHPKKSLKKTFAIWIIFGCNPCLDALVLFIFALSVWNIFFASLVILAFSLWLALMLWLLAIFVSKWYNFLNNKKSQNIKKILNILIFILWIFIILTWIFWFLR